MDPLTASYPWYTPYQFAGNKPIESIDLDGLEEHHYVYTIPIDGEPHLTYVGSVDIIKKGWTAGNRNHRKWVVKSVNETTSASIHVVREEWRVPIGRNQGIYPVYQGKKTLSKVDDFTGLSDGEKQRMINGVIAQHNIDIRNFLLSEAALESFAIGVNALRLSKGARRLQMVEPRSLGAAAGEGSKIPIADNPLIVIGEGQGRVNKVARQLKKQGYEVRTITDDWAKEYKIDNPYVPELHEAGSVEYNRRWIRARMDEGYDVFDIGGDGRPKSSPFYRAEYEELRKANYDKHYLYNHGTGQKFKVKRIK